VTERPGPSRTEVALAVPVRAGACLVARRAPDAHLGGLWEFPGGKIAPGESPIDAARRELAEETGLTAHTLEPLVVVVHDYADRSVRLHGFLARDPEGEVSVEGGREWAWVSGDELPTLEMPVANTAILRALRWRLR
jgi:8-oxo-dGTP diphosphatase